MIVQTPRGGLWMRLRDDIHAYEMRPVMVTAYLDRIKLTAKARSTAWAWGPDPRAGLNAAAPRPDVIHALFLEEMFRRG